MRWYFGIIKEKSISVLMNGLSNYENKKDSIKNADFKSVETFIKQYLNTADKKQRLKLSEEFKKRHLELYEFLKSNSELVNAETEINKMVSAIMNGDTASSEDKKLSNLFEIIQEGVKK